MTQEPLSPTALSARRTNRWLGALMLVLGILLAVSFFYAPLEVMVIIGGALLMLFGLGAIMVVFVKQMPAEATWLGSAAVLLGALIFVHDLMLPAPVNTITHGAAALVVVALALIALLGRFDFAARFQKQPRKG